MLQRIVIKVKKEKNASYSLKLLCFVDELLLCRPTQFASVAYLIVVHKHTAVCFSLCLTHLIVEIFEKCPLKLTYLVGFYDSRN